MLLIEQALYAVMNSDTAIKDIVGENIYPVTVPQMEKGGNFYPAIVYGLEDRQREQTHQGPTRLVKSFFIVSCLGPEYFAVKQLATKVRLALNGKSSALMTQYGSLVKGVFLTSEKDDYAFDTVEELSLFYVPMSFTIQHWEELTE